GFTVLCYLCGLAAAGGALSIVAVLMRQCGFWLKMGVWTPYPTWEMLMDWGVTRPPHTDWIGLQKIVLWALEMPAMLWVGVGCFVLLRCCVSAEVRIRELEAEISMIRKEWQGKR